MTKEELLILLDEIDGAYPSFGVDKKLSSTWYKYLGKFDKRVLDKCVTDWIMENQRPPTIADFYKRCERLTKYGYTAERVVDGAE